MILSSKSDTTARRPSLAAFQEFRKSIQHRPTYVVMGVQGSGTNLTLKILRQTFGISIVRDRSLILNEASCLAGGASEKEVAAAQKRVMRCLFPGPIRKRILPRQWFHQASEYQGIAEHLEAAEITTPAEFADFFYSYHAFRAGLSQRGIKSDDCWQHLEHIDDVIPRRKTILVVRDPRDNANSIMHKDFGPRSALTASRYVERQLDIYLREVQRCGQDAIIVNYETLLGDPRSFVDQFANLSGLDPCDDVDAAIREIKIRRSNLEKWRTWRPKELTLAEAVLRDRIIQLGYTPAGLPQASIPGTTEALDRITDVLQRIPQRFRTTWDHKVLAK